MNENGRKTLSIEEIALGFVHVANESMSRPIRALTEVKNEHDQSIHLHSSFFLQGKGFDLRDHVLACFGGAGGQHACAVSDYESSSSINEGISFRLLVR